MSEQSGEAGALWGGRFEGATSAAVAALSRSIHFDWRLAKYDIAGTRAHIRALQSAGYLNTAELEKLDRYLVQLGERVAEGSFTAKPADEDVHSALERGLIEIAGAELGGKVRAGRSRNDQIATLIRTYLLDEAKAIEALVVELIQILTCIPIYQMVILADLSNLPPRNRICIQTIVASLTNILLERHVVCSIDIVANCERVRLTLLNCLSFLSHSVCVPVGTVRNWFNFAFHRKIEAILRNTCSILVDVNEALQ